MVGDTEVHSKAAIAVRTLDASLQDLVIVGVRTHAVNGNKRRSHPGIGLAVPCTVHRTHLGGVVVAGSLL